jgi:hypothetical protein
MKELLNKLGITQAGYFSKDKSYIIDFEDDKEYNKAFSRIDKSNLLEEDPDTSVINTNVSNIVYTNDNFILNMIADFDSDTYKLVVKEI